MRVALKGLLKSQGWARLVEAAEDAVRMRSSILSINPEGNVERDLMQKRGEITGIHVIMQMPQNLIDEMDTLIEEKEEEDEAQ